MKANYLSSQIFRLATRISQRSIWIALGIAIWFAMHFTSRARAHDGEPPQPHDLLTSWSWEPGVLLGLGLLAWLYFRGLAALWKTAGIGHGIHRRQVLAFSGSLLALFAALVSPLDAVSSALFSAHMLQHLLLIFLAAPLLVLSGPQIALPWAFPARWTRRISRQWHARRWLSTALNAVSSTLGTWLVYAAVLWLWHLPSFYQAALANEFVHILEHTAFLGAALLFWWAVIRTGRHPNRLGATLLLIFTTALHSGLLGALLTFSTQAWYPVYSETTTPWGLTSLQDQQLAGAIMWMPAGIIYLAAFLWVLGSWLHTQEHRPSQPPPARNNLSSVEVD